MDKANKRLIVILLTVAAIFIILVSAQAIIKPNNADSELAALQAEKVSAATVKPVINTVFSEIEFDQNQQVRLINALNNGIVLPEPEPDKLITLEISLSLTDGTEIVIGDSGNAEFLVTDNSKPDPRSFLIASTDLENLLRPYQDLFKREISLKKNITLYGTDRITGVVLEDTPVREEASVLAEEVFELKKGDLIRTLAKKASNGVEWFFIDSVALSIPNPVGWVESTKLTFQPTTIMPNEGFLNQEVSLFPEPSINSPVLQEISGALSINKRANGWAYCAFPGGLDGWVRETDISYAFPANYDMGY